MLRRHRRAAVAALVALAILGIAVPGAEAAPPRERPTHAIAWGTGVYGQLGNGANDQQMIPVEVRRPELRLTEVAGSFSHSLAIAADGTVWAWGQNNHGQLGDGTTTDSNEPVQAQGPANVVEVAAGWGFSLARTAGGDVWACGANDSGQLGLGWFGGSYAVPRKIPSLRAITHIDAGWFHALALQNHWSRLAWGSNSRGQLGIGSYASKAAPVPATGLVEGDSGPVYDVAAGLQHSLAVRSDGTLLAWGANHSGQLGDGAPSLGTPSPVKVAGTYPNVRAVAAGCSQSYLADGNGRVWGWGNNERAQVAVSGAIVPKPQLIPGLSGVVDVAAGCAFGLALTAGGEAYGWGQYESGQTGTGRPVPMPPFPVVWGTAVTFIAAGGDHGLAARELE